MIVSSNQIECQPACDGKCNQGDAIHIGIIHRAAIPSQIKYNKPPNERYLKTQIIKMNFPNAEECGLDSSAFFSYDGDNFGGDSGDPLFTFNTEPEIIGLITGMRTEREGFPIKPRFQSLVVS